MIAFSPALSRAASPWTAPVRRQAPPLSLVPTVSYGYQTEDPNRGASLGMDQLIAGLQQAYGATASAARGCPRRCGI